MTYTHNTEPARVRFNNHTDDTQWESEKDNQSSYRENKNVFSVKEYIDWLQPDVKLTVDGTELDLETVAGIIQSLNYGHNDSWTADSEQVRISQVEELRLHSFKDKRYL